MRRALVSIAIALCPLVAGCPKGNGGYGATDFGFPVLDQSQPDLGPPLDLAQPDLANIPCGVRGTAPCPNGTFCLFPVGGCGANDIAGNCVLIPTDCSGALGGAVCGCDNNTYANDCLSLVAGVSVQKTGSCDGACVTNADCAAGTLCCYPCGIPGCKNQCLTPMNGMCPLFP
jgi:hypothetical protein